MGKHAALEGASADPIVAEALAHRSTPAVHHAAAEGPVGWPGTPAPEGGGLGWPADLDIAEAAQNGAVDGGEVDSVPVEPAPPVARRSWRRLLGVSRVA
ncbi:MAG TPA: hypothetical protein VE463_01255 [Blastococcus sp.]|nr:hypothetical protein [Blastococcus sp.]